MIGANGEDLERAVPVEIAPPFCGTNPESYFALAARIADKEPSIASISSSGRPLVGRLHPLLR